MIGLVLFASLAIAGAARVIAPAFDFGPAVGGRRRPRRPAPTPWFLRLPKTKKARRR